MIPAPQREQRHSQARSGLYAEKESSKYERAAVKWLRRYLNEASPELSDVAKVAAELDQRRDAPYA
jgi:hypothetical protein